MYTLVVFQGSHSKQFTLEIPYQDKHEHCNQNGVEPILLSDPTPNNMLLFNLQLSLNSS